jgi:hypothetical protein
MTAAKKLVRKSIRSVEFSRLELPFKPPAAGTVLTTSRSALSLRRFRPLLNLFKSFLQFNPGLRLFGDIYCGPIKFHEVALLTMGLPIEFGI